MISFSEEIANLYFTKKGYFVKRNLQYLGKTSEEKAHGGNIDIDLVAYKGNELNIVSCKRGSLDDKELKKELRLFGQAKEEVLRRFPWIKTRIKTKLKYIYFGEYISEKNKKFFDENNITSISILEAINEILSILREEMGPKKYDGKETEILPRILKFLIKKDRIKF